MVSNSSIISRCWNVRNVEKRGILPVFVDIMDISHVWLDLLFNSICDQRRIWIFFQLLISAFDSVKILFLVLYGIIPAA
jgi:hypothetical protein